MFTKTCVTGNNLVLHKALMYTYDSASEWILSRLLALCKCSYSDHRHIRSVSQIVALRHEIKTLHYHQHTISNKTLQKCRNKKGKSHHQVLLVISLDQEVQMTDLTWNDPRNFSYQPQRKHKTLASERDLSLSLSCNWETYKQETLT